MKWNPQTLQFLSQTFLDTLSPHPELRRRAEKNLSDAADNYGLAVLRLVAEPSFDEQIRLPDGEKEQIKSLIVPLMLSATPKLQAQFIEALASIGHHDFPNLLPALLTDLISRLETGITACDFASVNCILAAVNSLFNKFRCQFNNSNPMLLLDLKYCVDNFGATLLITAESICKKINASVSAGSYSVATPGQLLEAQRLCCKIFYSLNFFDVPEKFEDIYIAADDQWMNEFKNYLTIEDGVVCENISHYMEKEEELLQKHSNGFLKVVESLLVAASVSPSRERLTVAAIKFLTIVSTSVHHELFASDDEKLEQITQNIVIPYVMLRNEDEELIKKNCIEFINKDMDGNDRRRNAFKLLKGIAGNYKEKISTQIHHCLALSAENPTANWKYKELAIYLVVTTLASGGGTDLVNVEGFFRSVIVPELQSKDVNAFPMLKAAALKFFIMFRVLIPKHVAMPLLGDVVRFIRSDVNVVRSYAAICIEKLLLVKDNDKNGVLQARYTSKDIGPLHKDLFFNLFGALEILEKNHYIMRCIMRVVQTADISEMYSGYMFGLSGAVDLVGIGKPKNLALYNHFLFEAIACFVRRACEKEQDQDQDPCFVTAFQTCILRIFIDPIWRGDATELFPYAFQLLAQLVDLNTPLKFMDKFDEIFLRDPDFELWENSANVLSLVRLLQSYLQQAPREVNRKGSGRLRHVVLGIINKLVSSPTTEEQGFHLLNTVIQSYGYDVVAEYMNHIWGLVVNRLKSSTTPRLVRRVIVFMSLFLVKHGVQTLVDLINSVQACSFHVILREFWIPYLKTISTGDNYTEVKLSSVASTKLLFESASLLNPAAEELWGKLLDAIVTLLSVPLPDQEERLEDDDPDFHSGFVPLQNVGGRKKKDPLNEIMDPKHFLVAFPAHLCSQLHGRFPLVLMRLLSPPNQAALVNTCNSYNIAIV